MRKDAAACGATLYVEMPVISLVGERFDAVKKAKAVSPGRTYMDLWVGTNLQGNRGPVVVINVTLMGFMFEVVESIFGMEFPIACIDPCPGAFLTNAENKYWKKSKSLGRGTPPSPVAWHSNLYKGEKE